MSRFCCGIVVAIALSNLNSGQSICRAADAKPSGGEKAAEVDPFRVPDGTIEELQRYIERLKLLKSSSSLRPAGAEFRKKRAAAQLAASEKIMAAMPAPTPEQFRMAMRFKVAALTVLERMGDDSATAKIEAAIEQGQQFSLSQQAAAIQLAVQQGVAPPAPLPPGPSPFARGLRYINIEGHVQAAAALGSKDYLQLVDRLADFLKQSSMDEDCARLSAQLAMAAEEPEKHDLAVATYTKLGEVLATSQDEKVKSIAATMCGAARRLELVGKPFPLQGTTPGGRAIDAKKYKGKVVLVDFFATWCGPCREEIPNITKCYKAYRKRGFDVVGVSLDRDRKAIEDFLDKEKYPWTVLLDHYEARGTDKSLATFYGIFTIPQMVLIGKDGKVVSLDVRGERLEKALAEMLGPADSGKPKKAAGAAEQASK